MVTDITLPLLITAIGSTLLLLLDCRSSIKESPAAGATTGSNDRLSDLALLSPFIALFYTDTFWTSLLFTVPLILVVLTMQSICYRKGWLSTPPEPLALAPGVYLLAILGYFMFFHEGLAGPNAGSENIVERDRPSWIDYWPYAAYLITFTFTATRRSTDGICLSILFLALANCILPFFTDHYWWAMLAGFVMLMLVLNRGLRHLGQDEGGALSMIGGYFYMLTAFGSVIVYAILY